MTNQPTLYAAEDLMPRVAMSSKPRHWMVLGQMILAVQCCAEAPLPCLSTALHTLDQLAKCHQVPYLR